MFTTTHILLIAGIILLLLVFIRITGISYQIEALGKLLALQIGAIEKLSADLRKDFGPLVREARGREDGLRMMEENYLEEKRYKNRDPSA